ncbi:hypothetical protein HBI32_180620 [Parastagonospora nodorum]|nr:hypothetical protein HBI32_180620 [Parastagonospora nodorum]
MAYHFSPHIDASPEVIGHAHPSPITDTMESNTDQSLPSLHQLVDKVMVDVVLRGFSNEDLAPSLALVLPRVRRPPPSDDTVQHLELVSLWKGLSHSQSIELAWWERLFKQSLASQIKQHLLQDVVHRLSGYPNSANQSLVVPRMVKLLSSEQPLVIKICMIDLVDDMMSRIYAVGRGDEAAYRDFEWSLSSKSLPNFVFNFVRTQDCLLHAVDGPYLIFDLSNSYTVGSLTVFADLQWQLPRTTFSALPTRLSDGDTYRIIPHFSYTSLGASGYSGFSASKDEITYTVTRSQLTMKWDSAHKCFFTRIAHDSERPPEVLETVLSTKIATEFDDGVRFERVARYSIKLEVGSEHPSSAGSSSFVFARHDSQDAHQAAWFDSPQSSSAGSLQNHGLPWMPSYTNTPQPKMERMFPPPLPGHLQRCAPQNTMCNNISHSGQHMNKTFDLSKLAELSAMSAMFEPSSSSSGSSVSAGKRKALPSADYPTATGGPFALDRIDECHPVVPKRRKLSPTGVMDYMNTDSDDELFAHLDRITTGPMGSAESILPSADPLWSKKLDESSKAPRPFPATLASTKQTSFTWRSRKRHSISSTTSSFEDASPQATTSASSEALSQEQIQINYREFEQRKAKKEQEKAYYMETIPGFDRVVSPTDVEGKTFEGIFLGDEDEGEWTEDGDCEVDGVSEGVGSVCLEV